MVVKPLIKNLRFVNPSMLLGESINQPNSLPLHDDKGMIKSKRNRFLTFKVIKN